jgi:opacity protein-like surface antigen
MKKPLMGILVLLAAAWSLAAQEFGVPQNSLQTQSDPSNVAVAFNETSAARVNLFDPSLSGATITARSFAGPAASSALPSAPAPAAPAPAPRILFGDRDDYRWQLALSVEFLRFQSNVFSASMVGLNTSITYFTNDWFGFEGNVATGFAPTIYDNEHVKYLGYAGGVHVGSRRARWEPWGHALFGGGHLLPQTAGNSKNSFEITAGGGVDYRVYARLSLRAEADYVYTHFFSQTQNCFQGTAGVVIHF